MARTAPKKLPGWKLVWHDEFDGDSVDTSKWDFDIGNGFYDYKNHAWIPGWGVPLSYGVAIAYVLVDTADKGVKAYKDAEAELDVPTLNPAVDAGGCAPAEATCRV